MPRRGLSSSDARRRLASDGSNALPDPEQRSTVRIALQALREPMLLLLIAAGAIYLALGEPRDALVLLVSIVVIIALTIAQEYRAEQSLRALREQASPTACVLRDGAPIVVPARDIVIGDVLLVSAGDRLAADARVLEAADLMVDESLLTGESLAIHKTSGVSGDAGTLRAGTLVVRGTGFGEVTATGTRTELGRIGDALRRTRAPTTPLQRQMRGLVQVFATFSLLSCMLVAAAMYARGNGVLPSLLGGVTLAIANIPAEFPVVLTVYLALGAWRMSRRAVLVRRPSAIEALGSVTVLCTDKTGTLTENRMRVAELCDDRTDATVPIATAAALAAPLHSLDPMDVALRTPLANTLHAWSVLREYPFSAATRRVGMAWRNAGKVMVFVKGAPEAVACACGLSAAQIRDIEARVWRMAEHGLRVLGLAEASVEAPSDTLESANLRWRGLVAFVDPLRDGVPAAVQQARTAGMRVLMLTGDHARTAKSIAAQAGIAENDVFARVRPEDKLRLVQRLQAQGEVVAMTGDGINDAPALAAAHVGVAMGQHGTDVAREAASIVLVDDDFTSLVSAVAEGRRIYDNLGRAVRYIVAVHVPVTLLALLPVVFGVPPVLYPIHVVLTELIIDPACTIVFEVEPPRADLMQRPPRPPRQPILGVRAVATTMSHGLAMFAPLLALDMVVRHVGLPDAQVAALDFTVLIAGNVALMTLYRAGASFMHAALAPGRAFRLSAISTLCFLAVVTRAPGAARWLDFAPPPVEWWCVALLVPFLVAALLRRGLARL